MTPKTSMRRLASCLVATLAMTGLAATGHNASAAPAADPGSVAEAWVATRPAQLHAGPYDGFVQHAPIDAAGWSYVPYDRTYKGLPVVGGDFVVVIDPAGRVQAPSVAMARPITGLAVREPSTTATARRLATDGAQLVVYARSGTPRIAWVSTNAAEGITGYVDLATGAVLEQRSAIMHGSGYSGRNGPNPLYIATKHVHFSIYDRYYLIDPSNNGITCGDIAVGQPYWQTVDTWGNGDELNRVTGCTNAMFAQQKMVSMLSQWLGRNGIDGAGHGFPMWVGINDNNAYWNTVDHIAKFGSWYDGAQLTSLDLVGHELGHGVDQFTPGGMSGNGTPEFIADVFGTATEWFVNEPTGYDTRDWTEGDGYSGLERYMWTNPYNFPHCYYAGIETAEPHLAATVGDRWFYLMSEGSNPTDGQPASWGCNNTTVSPVGFMTALRILYNAMLMKTSNSSYPTYRLWTVRAAYNMYGCTGEFVTKVKTAWSAVGVPPQLAEPLCGIL
jgi:Zn-dependent metalloprotease